MGARAPQAAAPTRFWKEEPALLCEVRLLGKVSRARLCVWAAVCHLIKGEEPAGGDACPQGRAWPRGLRAGGGGMGRGMAPQ